MDGHLESVLADWDGEFVHIARDEPSGAWMFIAIHSTRLGPGAGGTRLNTYASAGDALVDATRLAAAMTLKMAVADMPMGGAKAVLAVPGELDPEQRRGLLLHHADNVNTLGGRYRTGPDMNTTSADMDVLGERTPYAFGRSRAKGGSGSSAPDTAIGVFHGIRASCAHAFGSDDLSERTVLVQGVGAVGEPLAELLTKAGAGVLLSDIDPTRAMAVAERLGGRTVPPDEVIGTECDVYAPCATGGVLDVQAIPQLCCRVVAGAANNPLGEVADGDRLRDAGILYAPDFVINGGGVLHLIGYEALGWTAQRVEQALVAIGATLTEIYRAADAQGISTELAAEQLAAARLAR